MAKWKRATAARQLEISRHPVAHAHLFSTKRKSKRKQVPVQRRWQAVMQASVLAIFFSALVIALLPTLAAWCAQLLDFGALSTALPVSVVTEAQRGWLFGSSPALFMPDQAIAPSMWALHAWLVAIGFATTILTWTHRPQVAMLLGALSVWHGLALAVAGMSAAVSYDLHAHTAGIYTASVALIVLAPAVLGVACFLFEPSWAKSTVACGAMLTYLCLGVPIKMLMHAWIAKLLSVLVLPLLFVVLGPLFDVMMFVALYAWALSWSAAPSSSSLPTLRSLRPAQPH